MTTLTPEQVAQIPFDHLRVVKDTFTMADPADVPAAENIEPAPEPDEVILDFEALYNEISVAEAGALERLAGVPFLNFPEHIRGTAALIYYVRRKVDPKFTYQQALELKVGEVVSTINRSAVAKLKQRLDERPLAGSPTETTQPK